MAKGSSRERREEAEKREAFLANQARRAAMTPAERRIEDYNSKYPQGHSILQDIFGQAPIGSPAYEEQVIERKKPDDEYKQLWEGYLGFRKQIGGGYTQNIASATVRMASSGVKPGSQEWESTLSRLDTRYESDIENIKAGETYGMLKEHAKDKDADNLEDWYTKEWEGDLSAPKRYQERQAGVPQYQSKLVGGGATIGGPSTIV